MKKLLAFLLSLLLVVSSIGTVTAVATTDTAIVYGDVDSNGEINNKDLAMLMQYINYWGISIDTDAADVNADGEVNNRDYALLMQYVNEWDVTLGSQTVIPPSTDAVHTPLATDEYYQYVNLNATQQAIYLDILDAIKEMRNVIDVSKYDISFDEGPLIFKSVLADYPEFFFVSRHLSATRHPEDTNKITALFIYYTDGETVDKIDSNGTLTVIANRDTIAKKIKQFNQKVEDVLKTIPVNSEDIVKEKVIYDWIIDNTTYDYDSANKPDAQFGEAMGHAWDIYGALIDGKIVCEGYAKAFVYLCHQVGINATTVSGHCDGIGHMWNAVEIEKEWYMIDVTWDDVDLDFPFVNYFNNTTKVFNNSRTTDTMLAVPVCTATKYTYENAFTINISNGQLPNNYKTIIDRVCKGNGKWITFYIDMDKGVETEWLRKNVWNTDSPLHKYINEKGYNIKISSFDSTLFYCYLHCKLEK